MITINKRCPGIVAILYPSSIRDSRECRSKDCCPSTFDPPQISEGQAIEYSAHTLDPFHQCFIHVYYNRTPRNFVGFMLIQGTCFNIRRLGQCRMIGIEGTEDVSIERGSAWLGGAHAQASHRVSTQDAGNCRGTRCCTNPYNMGAENMGIPNLICKYTGSPCYHAVLTGTNGNHYVWYVTSQA